MDLATFRSHYASQTGVVECVLYHTSSFMWSHLLQMTSRSQLNFFTNHSTNATEYIFIFFSDERSVGVKTMRKYVAHPCEPE